MNVPEIKITIIGASKKLSETITSSIKEGRPYKYVHSRLLVSRLQAVKYDIKDLPEEEQIKEMRNVLIAERNIASIAADQYAELNKQDIFEDLIEIIEEIDNILNQ